MIDLLAIHIFISSFNELYSDDWNTGNVNLRKMLVEFYIYAAQHSVQLTGGTLPDLQALFDPEVLSGLKADITPPTSN